MYSLMVYATSASTTKHSPKEEAPLLVFCLHMYSLVLGFLLNCKEQALYSTK